MLGRRSAFPVVAALVLAGAVAFAGWSQWLPGEPQSVRTHGISVPQPNIRPEFLDRIGPALPPSPGLARFGDEPQLAPSTEGGEVVPRGPGRYLRVGVARPSPSPATVADAIGRQVPLFSSPGDAEPGDVIDNPTWEGLPVVFLVQRQFGDWLEVQVSMRPNQSTAWARAADVTLRQVPYRVVVNVTSQRLTAYLNNAVVLEAPVAVGKDATPTPTGEFFIDGLAAPPDPSGPYGAYQLSVAAFSNVLHSFGSGVGQIAIHGTNAPDLIGTPVSNGCIRMTNEDVTRLASTVPIGTPVRIVA